MLSEQRLGFAVLGVVCASLPVVAVTFVPATDLPQHLAQVRMLDELWGLAPTTMSHENVEVRLGGANTLVYLPMFLLARIFPLLLAGKLTVLLLLVSSVVALHALASARGRAPLHAVLAGTLVFSVSLYWGFLNFLCGLPLFLWLLRYALHAPEPSEIWKDALRLSLLFLALYLAHVLWLPAAGLALLVGVAVAKPARKVVVGRALSMVPAGLLALHWYPKLAAAREESGVYTGAYYAYAPWERLDSEWFAETLFGGIHGWLETAATLALVLYGVAVVWAGRKDPEAKVDRGLVLLGALFCAFALLAPDQYMNTILFSRRFLAVGAMLLLLSLPAVRRASLTWAVALWAGLFAVSTTFAWALYDQDELDGLREALAMVDEPKSVLGLNHRPASDLMRGNPFLQTFAYFQALHGGELNFSFAEHASSIVAYKTPRQRSWQAGLEWFPEYVTKADIAAFDCVLLNGSEAQHEVFVRFSGLRSPQERGYFRLYCHAFGGEQITTGVPR